MSAAVYLFCFLASQVAHAQPVNDAITPIEARAIAMEAAIYGFPLVDNYRVMHSFFVDRDGKDFKAQWNQIHNEARVFTHEDRTIQTAISDTPAAHQISLIQSLHSNQRTTNHDELAPPLQPQLPRLCG
jgi:hypothetical protein